MNLRHKKPINSYRGQANNDKNEFNDDDFKHQPSPSKKISGNSGEQMYKYSKILAKFIINANQFYRDRTRNPKKSKTQIDHILQEAKVTRDQSRSSKYGKIVQQPKSKTKIMSKIQHEKLQFKLQKQKQIQKIDSQSKPSKELIQELQQQKSLIKNIPIKSDLTKTQTYPPKTQTYQQKPQTYQQKPQTFQPKVQTLNKQKNLIPIPQNFMNIYGQGMPMAGFPNPAIFTSMPINQYMGCYQEMMRLSMLQQLIKNEQMKGINFGNLGPQFMANIIANADMMNLKQNLYQNYMRNIPQPLVQAPKKNPSIYNLTQVFLTRKQSIFNQSKQKPNQIVKRANFHVGIAYHIYLLELQKKNIDIRDILKIDPTRQSRQIKEKQQGVKRNARAQGKK